jgi:hypothetical protein
MLTGEAKKQANKLAQAKFRAKNKGITKNPVSAQINNTQDEPQSIRSSNTPPVIPPKVIPIVIPKQVIPSNTLPEQIAGEFIGSPVHCLPEDYNRVSYLAMLPDNGSEVVRVHNSIKHLVGVENNPDDLDLRIARAVHYQRVTVNV